MSQPRGRKFEGKSLESKSSPWEISLPDSSESSSKAIYNSLPTGSQEHSFLLPISNSAAWYREEFSQKLIGPLSSSTYSEYEALFPFSSLDTLFLLFSQYPAIPQYTWHIYSLFMVLFSWAPEKVVTYSQHSPLVEAFRVAASSVLPLLALPSLLVSACFARSFPPSFSPIRNCYQLNMDRFMPGWGPARLPLIV